MRIQDTDRILKESRIARNAAAHTQQSDAGTSRVWRMFSSLPEKLTSFFRRS